MHNARRSPLFLLALAVATLPFAASRSAAQGGAAAAGSPAALNQSSDPRLAPFRFRSLGPAAMGGRVDAVAVAPSDANVIYVGYAVGGVFRSTNNGTTFTPVFERYSSASIGDIAIHPTNPDIVYVGTGEQNNRQTSSFGDGLYKTVDGGRSFTRVGLRETQTIARIVIDPRHPNVIYVAALGHLYGPNAERGIYKSTDAGATWAKIKYVDENTGFTELVMDPSNSSVLYAASYQRRRRGCCYNGGGPGSALWKTTDAGGSWTKLTGDGLPPGPYGRIAIDVAPSDPKIVYAQIGAGDAHLVFADPAANAPPPAPTPGTRSLAPGSWTTPGGDANRYWCDNGAQSRSPAVVAHGTPLLDPAQGGIFRSSDGGASWTLVNNCNERPMYFSQIRVDPRDANLVYVGGGVLSKSADGGKTLVKLDPVHSDQHAIWIDPRSSRHLMVGNDGALNISYDQGESWILINSMATATAYSVTADTMRPYNLYVGLQDNATWGGPSATRGRGIQDADWFRLPCVGDGFATAVDPAHPNIVYCEGQDGSIQRVDLNSGRAVHIRPSSGPDVAPDFAGRRCVDGHVPPAIDPATRNGRARNVVNAAAGDDYRFNWNTPFILSPHDPSVVYLGGNRLFRSSDRGESWTASGDLTRQLDRCAIAIMGAGGDQPQLEKNDGVVWYGTIVSVAESPVQAGVVWAGTDDGTVQVSRDGGRTFADVSGNLPALPRGHDYFISKIEPSHFHAGTAYVAVDGHRSDDLRPYIFVTRDFGRSFRRITTGLPAWGNVLVVREDPRNGQLLFAGTEFGLHASLDGGEHWQPFMTGYPTVRTDDILIHPRDGDLVAATHGRGVFIADDITPLEQLTPEVAARGAFLFEPRETVAYLPDLTRNTYTGDEHDFVGENPAAGPTIAYYLGHPAERDASVAVADSAGRVVATLAGPRTSGIHKLSWPSRGSGTRGTPRLEPGRYTVTLTVNGAQYTQPLRVLEDRWFRAR